MSGFVAFFRKELLEQVRTFRLPILLVAFALVGLGSPLLAKVTPELVQRFTTSEDMGGMELVVLKDPDVGDALFQYQKNFALLPLLVILMNFGAIAAEKSRRTAPMALVKPVSRRAFLLAKAAVPALLLVAGTAISTGACLLYTTLLFEASSVDVAGFLAVNGMLLLVLFAYLALTLFASVVTPGGAAAAGVGLGGFALFAVLGALPAIGRYTPAGLSSAIAKIILGQEVVQLGASIGATVALTLALLFAGERVLSRQEL